MSTVVKETSLSIMLCVPGAHNDRFAVTTLSTVVKLLRQQTLPLVRMDAPQKFCFRLANVSAVTHISETDIKTDGEGFCVKMDIGRKLKVWKLGA